jgi:hypothetical protein
MKKAAALLIFLLTLTSSIPLILSIQAQPTNAVVKPKVSISSTANANFSGYNITENTTDGGWIIFLFVWQRKISWNRVGFSGEVIYDTPPMLQMAKYYKNGTLDYSITYVPLYLIQYKDANNDSLFDLWTTNRQKFSAEIDDDKIDWWTQMDKPYKAYSLAPIFYFSQQYAWEWKVSPLTSENITVNGTIVPVYSWNISATVPSVSWLNEFSLGWGWHLPKVTTINVFLGFHITLLPINPQIKYDFKFSNITWANDDKSTKLSMMSAVLYHSSMSPVVRVENEKYTDFSQTVPISPAFKRFTIADNVTNNINAFISYSPNATVDGKEEDNVVETALQPLFLIPVPASIMMPEGFYIRGTIPGIVGPVTWKHYLAFSHQLGLPHFNKSIEQDPVISVTASLTTTSLPYMPSDLLPLRPLIVLVVISTVAVITYVLVRKRTISAF